MKKKRKKRIPIPKIIKNAVKIRQKNGCACCIESGREMHHVNPVVLSGKNSYNNIVFLCKDHHKLIHLGDLETCISVLEYVYYLHNGKLSDDLLFDLPQMVKLIREDYDSDYTKML